MFPSVRNTFGRVFRVQRQAQPLVRRIQSSSARAHPGRPRNGFGLGLGLAGVGLAGWYEWNTRVVHLDSPEKLKPKRVEKEAKFSEEQTPEASSSSSVSNAEEFLQNKEDEALEEAASQPPEASDSEESQGGGGAGGAFNPETGEINWDCPCLGGMAHGPCGQEFRDAFSCFVYSEEEPKGINCVEKFKGMQDCFRRHPEVYGEEIMADDDDEEATEGESLQEPEVVPTPTSEAAPAVPQSS